MAPCEGVPDMQQASGISESVFSRLRGLHCRRMCIWGVIYIQGEALWGEKLLQACHDLYLLVLKLLYDEQMAAGFIQQPYRDDSGGGQRKGRENSMCLSGLPSPDGDAKDDRTSEEISDYGACWMCWRS